MNRGYEIEARAPMHFQQRYTSFMNQNKVTTGEVSAWTIVSDEMHAVFLLKSKSHFTTARSARSGIIKKFNFTPRVL